MVANIDKMMYVGEKPWHGEGTKLDQVATAKEAIEASGLDWEVVKRPINYFTNAKKYSVVPQKFATVRTDRNIPLGIVGNTYRPLQNKEAFSFFDAVVGVKEAIYHTAGSLGQGEKIWILAKLPGYIKVTKDDIVDKYLLLANSHDGSSAVEMMFTPVRVVCQNTLNIAIDTANERIHLRHTISLGTRVTNVKDQLGIVHLQYQLFEELSQKLTNIQVNQEQYKNYLEKIGIVTKDEDGTLSTRTQNTLDNLIHLYEHGKGNDLEKVKGTMWGAFNSVVEYVDYVRGSDKNRTKSILYGSGAVVKQKAWDLAVTSVK